MHFFSRLHFRFIFELLNALFTLDSEFNNEQNIPCDLQQMTLKWMVIELKSLQQNKLEGTVWTDVDDSKVFKILDLVDIEKTFSAYQRQQVTKQCFFLWFSFFIFFLFRMISQSIYCFSCMVFIRLPMVILHHRAWGLN